MCTIQSWCHMAAANDEKSKQGDAAIVAPAKQPAKQPTGKTSPGKNKPHTLPPYHVVLLGDNDHTYEYVIEMMKSVFGYPIERGVQIAWQVDKQKRAIVLTTHKELAELKRDQIHAYGVDVRVATCAGSMSAMIIKAE